jgi:hypothetical protein
MKRILPNPELVHRPGPGPVAVEQRSLPSLPLEMLENIFEFLEFRDTCSALQTYRDLYYPVRINHPFWERLFLRHFASPRIVPEQSWLQECEMQNRLMFNIIAGRCAVGVAEVEGNRGVSCFTKGENGCLIICFKNGTICSFNQKTGKLDVLQPSLHPNDASHSPKKVVCQGGLYAVEGEREIRVWELATGKNIFIYKPKGDWHSSPITRMELMDGRLLIEAFVDPLLPKMDRPDDKPITIEIFDLRSKSDPIILPLSSSPFAILLQGNTLYCAVDNLQNDPVNLELRPMDQRIDVWDLETKTGQSFLNVRFPTCSRSFEMCLFNKETLFLFSEDSHQIFEYDLANLSKYRYLILWGTPGIPGGFYKEHALPCFMKSLSFLFDKCLPEQFAYWSCIANDGGGVQRFGINEAFSSCPWVFNRGTLSFLNATRQRIFFLDFTASKESFLVGLLQC